MFQDSRIAKAIDYRIFVHVLPTSFRSVLYFLRPSKLTLCSSGINAVMYYSTGILSQALPEAASYISLGVAVINMIMTFPPIFFVEVCELHHILLMQYLIQFQRVGQRRILLWSTWGSIISLLLLALSLNNHINIGSAIGTLLFVR